MGNYAMYADTVSNKFVEQQCPMEIQKLKNILLDIDYSMEIFAFAAYSNDLEENLPLDIKDEDVIQLIDAYNNLCQAFQIKTGLSLCLGYHDAENRGDEVDGAFWIVDFVYELTEAGKKYQNEIKRKTWTLFG